MNRWWCNPEWRVATPLLLVVFCVGMLTLFGVAQQPPAPLTITHPPDSFMYRDAMYYYLHEARARKPWLDVAVHAYIREYNASGSQESANLVFNALADLGTRMAALQATGSNWQVERRKEHEALRNDFFNRLRDYAPLARRGGVYVQVATDALALMEQEFSNQRRRRGPSDEMRFETYAGLGESARAYAENRREIADSFGRAHGVWAYYTNANFMRATETFDPVALSGLGELLTRHTRFRNLRTTKELKDSLPDWAARVDASWSAMLAEWNAVMLDRADGRLRDVEALTRRALRLMQKLQADLEQARVAEAKREVEMKEKFAALETLLRKHFDKEEQEKILAAERAIAQQLAQQRWEEKLGFFDSASTLFQQIASIAPDKNVKEAMVRLSGLAQVIKDTSNSVLRDRSRSSGRLL